MGNERPPTPGDFLKFDLMSQHQDSVVMEGRNRCVEKMKNPRCGKTMLKASWVGGVKLL
jgi:hypothetical protein